MKGDMRRLVILKSVIELYIERGEPVGSRVIADEVLRDVSSATIRNDMAALEQMGYLHQPHTSAGRIPTSRGYRFYINQLMRREPLSEENRRRIEGELVMGDLNPKELVRSASELLADMTDCASISAAGRMSWSMPLTWPAIRLPVSVSPSNTARRRLPSVYCSSSILSAPAFSRRTYSRLMRFFSTRTGVPPMRPVTMVSLSLALIRAAL